MKRVLLAVVVLAILIAAGFALLSSRDQQTGEAPAPSFALSPDPKARGRDLVRLADCQGCHTRTGGSAFAGGRGIPTRFGSFYAPNITPDVETGIGSWNADDFWNALHRGIARDGTRLYPTFPYTNYTKISRADSDGMFAYLRTIPAVRYTNREHVISFPYNQRWLLAAWRMLYFRPGVYKADSTRGAEWNRGAYLTEGLAHCSACHEARNSLGAIRTSSRTPTGGLVLDWYAPTLSNPHEGGVQQWSEANIVSLLKTGLAGVTGDARRASAMGPMAEVVFGSLQHVRDEELRAMAVYLKAIPETELAPQPAAPAARSRAATMAAILENGQRVYADNCSRCHGDNGEGRAPAAPALASNRAVTIASTINPIRIVLYGGFPPGTSGNPRPFGMPPFAQSLDDEQVSDVLTYVRTSWGNFGTATTPEQVRAQRTGPLW